METMIALALLLWGWTFPVVILGHDGRQEPAYANVTAHASAPILDGVLPCDIWFYAKWFALTPDQQQGVVTHEVGHCLGLDHVSYPSIMRDGTFWTVPQPADYAALRALHPLPIRGYVASISFD